MVLSMRFASLVAYCSVLVASLWVSGTNTACGSESAQNGTLIFILENDLFYGKDQHYTNGARFAWTASPDKPPPDWAVQASQILPFFPTTSGKIRHGYAFGQSMFVPSDIKLTDPPAGERPYAGWLYGSVGLGVETKNRLDQFWLSLGVVGPSSLAEQTQKFVHKVVGADDPKGWDTQLGDELGVNIAYQRSWRTFATTTWLGNRFDVTPHIGLALGNVFTYGNTGITLRYGPTLPRDYGPPRIQPSLPGSSDFSPTSGFNWYLFAGLDTRAVGRNIFLDGNTFKDSRSVEKNIFVGDLQFGFVLDWPEFRISYTHVLRTREFESQKEPDNFGALSVSLKF